MKKWQSAEQCHSKLVWGIYPCFGVFGGGALKKKREEIAKGSTTPQQAIFDPDATARNAKNIVRGETGLIINEFMERHYNPWDDNHIERPERLTYIRERFNQLDLIQRCKQVSK